MVTLKHTADIVRTPKVGINRFKKRFCPDPIQIANFLLLLCMYSFVKVVKNSSFYDNAKRKSERYLQIRHRDDQVLFQ